jgi:phage FluMu protein Com
MYKRVKPVWQKMLFHCRRCNMYFLRKTFMGLYEKPCPKCGKKTFPWA